MDVPASPLRLYALPSEHYTFNNLRGLINGVAKAHWAVKNDEGRSRVYLVIHITVALVEAVPGVGHVVALFELIIVRGVRCFLLKSQVIYQLPRPNGMPEAPPVVPVVPEAPPVVPVVPEAPPVVPVVPDAPPLSEINYPLVPYCSPASEPRLRVSGDFPLVSLTVVGMSDPVLPPSVLEAILAQQAADMSQASQQIYPIVPIVPFGCLPIVEVIEPGQAYPLVSFEPNEPAAFPLVPVEPPAPSMFYTALLSTSRAVASVYRVGSTLISLEETHSLRTLNAWFTTMAPAFHQLAPELFESSVDKVVTLGNAFRFVMSFNESSREGMVNRAIVDMMNTHCRRPVPPVVDPEDVVLVNAVSYVAAVSGPILAGASQAHDVIHRAMRVWGATKRAVANMVATDALSREQARGLAVACTRAMQYTMQEALVDVSQGQDRGADAANFLGTSTAVRALSYLGDRVLSSIIEEVLLQTNRAVNVTFTESRVMGPLGKTLMNVMVDNIPMPEGTLEAVQQLTAYLPDIDNVRRAMLDLVFLQYVKHIMVIQSALMKNGSVDFNAILASKGELGNPAVAEAFTALCSVISRGNPAHTASIEEGLRNILAVGQLAIHATSDRTMLLSDLAAAAEQDGWISDESSCGVRDRVDAITSGLLAWWTEPPGPAVERFKQLVGEGAREAASVSMVARNSHVEGALIEAVKRGTDVSCVNRAAAVGVQVGVASLNYYLTGNILGGLMSAGANITVTEGVLYARNIGIERAVGAARPDDRVASAVAQFCVLSDHVMGGMRK